MHKKTTRRYIFPQNILPKARGQKLRYQSLNRQNNLYFAVDVDVGVGVDVDVGIGAGIGG
jgi:hypothetical protein